MVQTQTLALLLCLWGASAWSNELVDQGPNDSRFVNLHTQQGIKLELPADERLLTNPAAMTFADNGDLYVLEWRPATVLKRVRRAVDLLNGTKVDVEDATKDTRDFLKSLQDTDGDGVFDTSRIEMNDLNLPLAILVHDGWIYLSSVGRVFRRRPYNPASLKRLVDDADKKLGPSTTVVSGGKWLEQELVRGIPARFSDFAGGMTIAPDGWLYVTSGGPENVAEGWDGSYARIAGSGGVFRMRFDGSGVSEYARGFENPCRHVAVDHLLNMYLVDGEADDGSHGARIVNVVSRADYGARLTSHCGLSASTNSPRTWNTIHGTLSANTDVSVMLPSAMIIYNAMEFPSRFSPLVICSDLAGRAVHGFPPVAGPPSHTWQGTMMKSRDDSFSPCQVVQGPDGAIYVLDRRTLDSVSRCLCPRGVGGRLYRLSWSGAPDSPGIPLRPRNSWQVGRFTTPELFRALSEKLDTELHRRVLEELVRRANRDEVTRSVIRKGLLSLVIARNPIWHSTRSYSLAGAFRVFDPSVQKAVESNRGELSLYDTFITDQIVELDRRPVTKERLDKLKDVTFARQSKRSRFIAVAVHGRMVTDPDTLLAYLRQQWDAAGNTPVESNRAIEREGIYRAIEVMGKDATDRLPMMFHNAVLNADSPDENRRGDLVFVLAVLESLRYAGGTTPLDAIVTSKGFLDIPWTDQLRVLGAFLNVEAATGTNADPVAEWLFGQPDCVAEVQSAALEIVARLGTSKGKAAEAVVARLLSNEDEVVRLRVIRSIGIMKSQASRSRLIERLGLANLSGNERFELLIALGKLMPDGPGTKEDGTRTIIVKALLEVLSDKSQAPSRVRDAMVTALSLDYEKALPAAVSLLDAPLSVSRCAVREICQRPQGAIEVAKRVVSGQVNRNLLPEVLLAVGIHVSNGGAAEIDELFKKLVDKLCVDSQMANR